jgi:hypothetical protein
MLLLDKIGLMVLLKQLNQAKFVGLLVISVIIYFIWKYYLINWLLRHLLLI